MAPETTHASDCPVLTCSFAGCEATFKRKDRLRSHLCMHEGTKPFKCSYHGCVRSYTNSAGLKRHEERNHQKHNGDGDIFICAENGCAKVYKSSDALKKHITNEHEKKHYECTSCSKRFYKHQQLKIHEFEHTGIKPFVCTQNGCEKRFILPSKLKAHQKYHQGYACKTSGCEKKFEKWTLLQKHIKLDHVPEIKCDRCSKVFMNKSNLRKHAATHDETRKVLLCPYDGCPRFFYFESNLNHHVSSTHEGRKHACTHEGCDKEFKHKINLKKHLKLHDPNAPLPQKKKRKCRKRRSMAAHLSGFKPMMEDDLLVITKEDETFKMSAKDASTDELPQVIITPCVDSIVLETPKACIIAENLNGQVNRKDDVITKPQVNSMTKAVFDEVFVK